MPEKRLENCRRAYDFPRCERCRVHVALSAYRYCLRCLSDLRVLAEMLAHNAS